MKKIMLMSALIIFLCCGCTVDYNLTINKDLTVKEEIKAMQPQSFFSEYINSTPEEVIDTIATSNGLSTNEYEKIIKKDQSGIRIKNNYTTIKEFSLRSEYYKQYFSGITYTNKDGKVTLNLESNIINDLDYPENFSIDKTSIRIKVPFKVTYSNADEKNEFTNTYIWHIYDDTESKNINIEFNTNESKFDYNLFIKYIPMILTAVILLVIAYVSFKVIQNKRIENNKF